MQVDSSRYDLIISSACNIFGWSETSASAADLLSRRGNMTGSQSSSSAGCWLTSDVSVSMNTLSTLTCGSLNSRVNASVNFFTSERLYTQSTRYWPTWKMWVASYKRTETQRVAVNWSNCTTSKWWTDERCRCERSSVCNMTRPSLRSHHDALNTLDNTSATVGCSIATQHSTVRLSVSVVSHTSQSLSSELLHNAQLCSVLWRRWL